MFSFLIPLSKADLSRAAKVSVCSSETGFFSKNLQTIEARPLWYPSHYRCLAILNPLSHNILSEAVILGNF